MRIVLIAHYYPPINSSGAKRFESLSKYFTALGHDVTVITTRKHRTDGAFTEAAPNGVQVIELDGIGREKPSVDDGKIFEPRYASRPSWKRRLKDRVMAILGQVPDPRLSFALAFLSPWLAKRAKYAIQQADIVIGTTPPWPMVLAALLCKMRFGSRCILDYRDHFSECHEMPGGRFAKWLEKIIDRRLVNAADKIVCISDPMSRYYNSLTANVETILNGYDHDKMEIARAASRVIQDDKVRIRYMGAVSPGRVPHNILKASVALRAQQPELFDRLRFEFYGNAALIQDAVNNSYPEISSAFYFFSPVSYSESLKKIIEADYLLFSETSSNATLSAQGILTTKLFEYIGSDRPILADISAETLAGNLLSSCGGWHFISQSPEFFFNEISRQDFFERKSDYSSPVSMSLTRKYQADRYIDLISRIVREIP